MFELSKSIKSAASRRIRRNKCTPTVVLAGFVAAAITLFVAQFINWWIDL